MTISLRISPIHAPSLTNHSKHSVTIQGTSCFHGKLPIATWIHLRSLRLFNSWKNHQPIDWPFFFFFIPETIDIESKRRAKERQYLVKHRDHGPEEAGGVEVSSWCCWLAGVPLSRLDNRQFHKPSQIQFRTTHLSFTYRIIPPLYPSRSVPILHFAFRGLNQRHSRTASRAKYSRNTFIEWTSKRMRKGPNKGWCVALHCTGSAQISVEEEGGLLWLLWFIPAATNRQVLIRLSTNASSFLSESIIWHTFTDRESFQKINPVNSVQVQVFWNGILHIIDFLYRFYIFESHQIKGIIWAEELNFVKSFELYS